ncbi:hypothetical protein Entas_0030 [Enterobacter soli]|uniref:DUF3304 domain-containing protein n=1 Tax=Enterobacter soli TaxID=885040 RepID=UPI000223C3F9|nr:DUF3304 domain-containing protein [Enterobacter soli]AEN62786.1 hypothetical protein Entas_0030 [Enterobacter soli]OAT41712.1 hypothetical protein M987_01198 [Enterobacter soli ATCC BAA-2102]
MSSINSIILLAAILVLAGCDKPVKTEPTPPGGGGTIEAINHTSWAINRFSVNGQSGLDIINPYSGGGGGCCFGVKGPWQPGMTVQVDWETGVAFASDVPEIPEPERPDTKGMDEKAYYKAWQEYTERRREWRKIIKARNKQHSLNVPLPDYTGQKTCGITVHFLPCDQVKVTTSCAAYGSPDYPIKERVQMEKPTVCPN